MRRDLGVILVVVVLCALGGRYFLAAPVQPLAVKSVGLGGVRPGDRYEKVSAAYGRMKPEYMRQDEWQQAGYGPFSAIVLLSQPGENDLWKVARLAGAPVTLDGKTVLAQGETTQRALELFGEPDFRVGDDDWRWAVEPSEPFWWGAQSGTPVLRLRLRGERVTGTEIYNGRVDFKPDSSGNQ